MTSTKSQAKNNCYCYIQNKHFGIYYIPARFQYLILRDYFKKIDALFNLPQGEPFFSKTSIRLRSLISDLKPGSKLILLSMYVLPENKIDRNEIIKIILKKKIELHLVFEKIIVKNLNDLKKINDILKFDKFNKYHAN